MQAPAARAADQGRAPRPRRWSPPCWSPNTPGICRSTGSPRCWPRRASTSSDRSWRSGWVTLRTNSSPSTSGRVKLILGSGKIAVDATRRRVPTLAAAGSRTASSGRSPERTTLGRDRSTGHRFHLCARPRCGACAEAARRLSRRRAMRRLRGLQEARRRGAGRGRHARLLRSHLRRRFYDQSQEGNAPIAREALECIAALYAIEKTIRGASAEERRMVRQERSKPLVARAQDLARAAARPRVRQGADRRGHPLRR